MRISVQPQLFSTATIVRVLFTALIYAIAIIPTKLLLMLMPGAEVRFAACIPVVAGMMWGPAGAIGSALGNFAADFYTGSSLYICFWGAAANFFLAYLPYKLWYSLSKNTKPLLFVHDTRSFFKFLIIIFVTALLFSSLLTAIILPSARVNIAESFFIFFSNNFDFPLLFGLPLLLWLHSTNTVFFVPKPCHKNQRPYYISLLVAIALCAAFIAFITNSTELPAHFSVIYLTVMLILLAYASRMPAYPEIQPLSDTDTFCSLSARATSCFLLLSIFSVLFVGFAVFIANPDLIKISKSLELWRTIFSTLLISINIIFIAMLFILWQTEKQVVLPLSKLSCMAHEFAGSGKLIHSEIPVNFTGKTDEIGMLYNSFYQMTSDINHYIADLSTAIAEKETITAQLDIAAKIQQGMLADTRSINRNLKGYEISAGMFPAREVGGDLYDCFYIDDEHLAILIADVSGKGIPAALFMTVTKALLKNNASLNPGKILEKTNNYLCENNEMMMFVTVWLGIVHLPSGSIIYANAGHNYPLVQSGISPSTRLKERSGPPLGAKYGISYKEYNLILPQESRLLLYTDGITEAENSHHEFYGAERLFHRFERAHIPDDILFSVLEFSEGTPQTDDITVLWLERK